MGLEEFRRYCREYRGESVGGSDAYRHDVLVGQILRNPGMVRLRHVSEVYKEVHLIRSDRSDAGRIDLIFFTRGGKDIYICEVKANRSQEFQRFKMSMEQLRKNYDFVRDSFSVLSVRISVLEQSDGRLRKTFVPPLMEDVLALAEAA